MVSKQPGALYLFTVTNNMYITKIRATTCLTNVSRLTDKSDHAYLNNYETHEQGRLNQEPSRYIERNSGDICSTKLEFSDLIKTSFQAIPSVS